MLKKAKFLSYMASFLILFSSSVGITTNKVLAASNTTRISGNDRYKTSMEILNSGWNTSKNLVLASGEDYPDALCSVPLAKQLSAPVLLNTRSQISDEVINKIIQLKVENIFIIGGEGSISKDVEDTLRKKANVNIVRLFGSTRYETSIAVANYLYSNFDMSKEAVVTSGLGFADSISIAPIAAQKNMPILLTDKETFSNNTKNFLSDNSIEKAYIIGGSGVISENVAKSYPSPERVWGMDRYETNLNVINRFNGSNANKVYVASGDNFPDALSGAALAGKDSSFIVLTSTSPEKAARNLVYNVSKKSSGASNVIILGGTGVVSDNVVKQLTTKDLDFSGNVINGGTVIYDNGNTYYYNPKETAFNQLSANGIVKKVAETSAKGLNVVGNTAYYVKNFSADAGIYKSNLDGSNRVKLSSNAPYSIQVYGDWIYYSKLARPNDDQYYLWRTKIGGSKEEQIKLNLQNDYSVDGERPFCIKDGWIYTNVYEFSMPYHKAEFVKTSLDGSVVKVIKENSLQKFQPVDNYIYYSDPSGIHRMKDDGSEDTLLASISYMNGGVYSINVFNDHVYYTVMAPGDKTNTGMYKMDLDGSNITKLSDDNPGYLFVVPGWIYYYGANGVSKVQVDT